LQNIPLLKGAKIAVKGNTLNKKSLGNLKIPLPETIDDQIKIANLLTQVETLIEKRKESITLLDELLKSTFLDMFGDPVLNPKGWEKLALIKVSNFENGDRSNKYPSGNDLVEKGILFLNTKNITNNSLNLTDKSFISKDKFDSLSKGKVKYGDILITLRGTLGNCCIYNSKLYSTAFINAQMMIIRPDTKMINTIFLHRFLISERINLLLKKQGNGAAVPQLTATQLKKLEIIVPPLKLQDKFATIVQQVEATKKHYQQSLNELNQLFGSLSQRAFRGELDLSKMEIEIPAEDTWTKKALAKQEAYEKALEEKVYKSDMSAVETVTFKTISTENIETYIMNLIKDDNFDIDEIKHQFGIDLAYDDFKKHFYGLLEEGKIIQKFDTQNKKMKFKAK